MDTTHCRLATPRPCSVHMTIGLIAIATLLGSPMLARALTCVTPPTQFLDESAFLAAARNGLSFESFEGLTTGLIDNPSIDPNGFVVTDPDSRLGINDANDPSNAHPSDGLQYLVWDSVPDPNEVDAITFTFDSPITAFGMFIVDPLDTPTGTGAISLSTDGGVSVLDFVTIADPNSKPSGSQFFIGVINADPFSVVTFSTTNNLGDSILFDGLHYGTATCCGDGTLDTGEQCDDGNNNSSDGCSAECVIEVCPEPPLPCDSVDVSLGQDQEASLLGGSSVPGGIDITFEDTTGGTLEAGLFDNPESTNFMLATEPPLLMSIVFSGNFSGDVGLVLGYNEAELRSGVLESQLVLYHSTDGRWRQIVPGIIDPNANTITVAVESFSFFDLGFARAQEKDQQKCINALNKNLAKVAKAQGKSICDCIKDFAKGKSLMPAATLEACLSADRKGKVAKAQSKTESDEAKKCSASTPDFGSTDSANVNDVALQTELDLIHDIFGSDLDTAIITEGDDKDTSKCQQQAAKAAKKCLDAKLKEFNKCKKNGLKDGSIQTFADLQSCIGADPKGKIAKACDPVSGKIRSSIDKKCGPPVDTSTAFLGCGTGDAATLAACLDQIVECQVCLALNQADNLARDCDDFDDGLTNDSCQ